MEEKFETAKTQAAQTVNGHAALITELQDYRKRIVQGGGPERIKAQHDKGKLTARERIARLL
ncbi:MAG TPA: hypothetical protein VFM05_07570, partial [Candidatus Saccharimonadales bacterium]|nr:hypothetical protein [Candidatus Saccharimonadales bacterium]